MWPDRVLNPGPLTYESGALPTALRGSATGGREGGGGQTGRQALKWQGCLCNQMRTTHTTTMSRMNTN